MANKTVSTNIKSDEAYANWLRELKAKVRQVQIKAAVKVNLELLLFYWESGKKIFEKEKKAAWGDQFLKQLGNDLRVEFPEMKGFFLSNLKYI